jgi:hypothetical protein
MENLINAAVIILIVGVGAFAVALYLFIKSRAKQGVTDIREAFPTIYERLPLELQTIINEAIRIGADFAESIDADGQIQKYLMEFQDKAEAKLLLATDTAVKYIEMQLDARGYKIDIPEDLIKRLLQVYVFRNRENGEFPSTTIAVDVTDKG